MPPLAPALCIYQEISEVKKTNSEEAEENDKSPILPSYAPK